jgi:putative hydrolase of the HAD superfamily
MTDFRKPAALLFDLDDTLIAWDAVTEPSWRKVCGEYASRCEDVTPEALCEAAKTANDVFWGDPECHRRGRSSLTALNDARTEVVGNALAELGVAVPGLAREIALAYNTERNRAAHLLPGAVETLKCVRERGYRTALVTNGASEMQRDKIGRFGLAPYFDAIAIEGELGFGKPDARHFGHALEALGIPPEKAWMAGDDLSRDIAGAISLGIYSIWVDWRGNGLPEDLPARPDMTVRAVSDFAGLL